MVGQRIAPCVYGGHARGHGRERETAVGYEHPLEHEPHTTLLEQHGRTLLTPNRWRWVVEATCWCSTCTRGIYSIGTNAQEHWRMPPAEWGYPKKRPRNEETIALHVHNETYTLTSRGGRIQRRSLDTGHLIEEHLIDGVEAPIEHHFNHEGEDLMCSSTGTVSWLQNGEMVQQVQLSGPVQGAVWDVEFNGWRIAGWREEVVISPHHLDRRATRELPIHIHPVSGGAFVLFNDGTWASSPFENVVKDEN